MITRELIGRYVKRVYVFIQVLAIILMCALFAIGFIDISLSFMQFRHPYSFLRELLHSLEILFIAPIPVLIVFSFRKLIILSFPPKIVEDAKPEGQNIIEKLFDTHVNEDIAKKAFISSIIGVMSTYLLGIFIKLLTPNEEQVSSMLHVSHDFINILAFYLLFILAMILLYFMISNHK